MNTKEMNKLEVLREEVTILKIKKRLFRKFFRPVEIVCVVLSVIGLMLGLVDTFIPFLPEQINYTTIVIVSLSVILYYIDINIDIKLREAKKRYFKFVKRNS